MSVWSLTQLLHLYNMHNYITYWKNTMELCKQVVIYTKLKELVTCTMHNIHDVTDTDRLADYILYWNRIISTAAFYYLCIRYFLTKDTIASPSLPIGVSMGSSTLLPAFIISDSFSLTVPGMSTSKRWIFLYAATMHPSLLITRCVLCKRSSLV